MVKLRGPLLCQSCHSQQGHPSFAYGPSSLPEPSSTLPPAGQLHELFACILNHPSVVADSVNAMEQRSETLASGVCVAGCRSLHRQERQTVEGPDRRFRTAASAWVRGKAIDPSELGAGYVDDSSAKSVIIRSR
jgi:hypothetical protein